MDENTQGKYILKDEKRPRLQPGSISVFQKLARGKGGGLSGQIVLWKQGRNYFKGSGQDCQGY